LTGTPTRPAYWMLHSIDALQRRHVSVGERRHASRCSRRRRCVVLFSRGHGRRTWPRTRGKASVPAEPRLGGRRYRLGMTQDWQERSIGRPCLAEPRATGDRWQTSAARQMFTPGAAVQREPVRRTRCRQHKGPLPSPGSSCVLKLPCGFGPQQGGGHLQTIGKLLWTHIHLRGKMGALTSNMSEHWLGLLSRLPNGRARRPARSAGGPWWARPCFPRLSQ
jgi:hypothetical protein